MNESLPYDMEEVFRHYINQFETFQIAHTEFKRALDEDDALRQSYGQWCHDTGNSEKDGFLNFCDELLSLQDDVWSNLTDYDDE